MWSLHHDTQWNERFPVRVCALLCVNIGRVCRWAAVQGRPFAAGVKYEIYFFLPRVFVYFFPGFFFCSLHINVAIFHFEIFGFLDPDCCLNRRNVSWNDEEENWISFCCSSPFFFSCPQSEANELNCFLWACPLLFTTASNYAGTTSGWKGWRIGLAAKRGGINEASCLHFSLQLELFDQVDLI